MSEHRRVTPKVAVQPGRHYGPAQASSVTRTFYNFTGQTLFITDQAGFRRALLVMAAPSKELNGKLIIEDRYHLRESAFEEMQRTGLSRDPDTIGENGVDPLTTFCNTRVVQSSSSVRSVEYSVDVAEFDHRTSVVLENIGISVELQANDPAPHPDNSFVLASGATEGGDMDEPEAKVSFYLKAKLIDPSRIIGEVFINVRGDAILVRPTAKDEERVPEGMYLTLGYIDKRGRLKKRTQVFTLDQVTEENGFFRSQREALDFGNVDVTKRRLERDTLEAKQVQSERDLEFKRIELDQKALELEQKRLDQKERTRERMTQAFELFTERMDSIAKSEKEKIGINLKFVADVGKSIAAILVAIGGVAKLFAALKKNPS